MSTIQEVVERGSIEYQSGVTGWSNRGLWTRWLLATVTGYLWAAAIATQLYPVVENLSSGAPNLRLNTSHTGGTFAILPQIAIGTIVIALFQWSVLRHYVSGVDWRQWVGANVLGYLGGVLGGGVALLILSPGLRGYPVMGRVDVPGLGVSLLVVAMASFVLGAVAALPQRRILTPTIGHTDGWIWTMAGAWAMTGMILLSVSIAAAVLAYQLATQAQRVFIDGHLYDVALGLISGLAMGLVVGAITGGALVRLLNRAAIETNGS